MDLRSIFQNCFLLMLLLILAPRVHSAQDFGYLNVTSEPKYARVFLGKTYANSFLSMTPTTELLRCKPGEHEIWLNKGGYKDFRKRIVVRRGQVLEIGVELAKEDSAARSKLTKEKPVEAYMTIKSRPSGADVYLDGKPIGKTPLIEYPVIAQSGEPRDRSLKIVRHGYEPYERKIRWIDTRNRVKLHLPIASLQPLPSKLQTSSSRDRGSLRSVLVVTCIIVSLAIITCIVKTRLHKPVKGGAKPGTLLPISKNGKWGYADRAGNVVIRTRFAYAGSFSEGLAYVSIRPKWSLASKYGYIDEKGEIVIVPQFDRAWDFSEGLACIEIAGKYGYIGTTGCIVSGLQFDWAGDFSEGMAWVRVSSKYIHITKDLLEQGAPGKEFTEFAYPRPG